MLVGAATGLSAQVQDTTEIARLRREVEAATRALDAVTRELEALKLGRDVVVTADTSVLGLGPAASKVYKVPQGVSIGGYGEVLYENFAGTRQDGQAAGRTDRLDALRAIVYVGYKFDDRVLFNSEIEIEHADEIGLEFAYVDYRISDLVGLRGGLLLVPMGFINELHEPPVFLGARRPATEQQLLPTTWRENGIGVFGNAGPVSYRAYVVNGLNAAGFTSAGLRGGRQKGSQALSADLAGVVRVDYVPVPGTLLGGSVYVGNSGQDMASPNDPDRTLDVRTVLWEAHTEMRTRGVHLRALLARGELTDVAELNTVLGLTGPASVGSGLLGWYVEAGYDVLRWVQSPQQLVPFIRHERLDTQHDVPPGGAADPARDQTVWTLGLVWKPIASVALKADYEIQRTGAATGVNQFNVNLSYLF